MKVFVSYRRAQVDEFFVGRLRDSLRAEFGRSRVFVDVYDLPGGSDFSAEIERQISASDALVLVIDERWNTQRLADAHDVLAKELRLGLARTMVIPVLVGGAVMPTEDQLPEEFRSLAHIQAVRVRPDPDFTADLRGLVATIKSFARTRSRGRAGVRPAADRSFVRRHGRAVAIFVAGVLIAAGVTAWIIRSPSHHVTDAAFVVRNDTTHFPSPFITPGGQLLLADGGAIEVFDTQRRAFRPMIDLGTGYAGGSALAAPDGRTGFVPIRTASTASRPCPVILEEFNPSAAGPDTRFSVPHGVCALAYDSAGTAVMAVGADGWTSTIRVGGSTVVQAHDPKAEPPGVGAHLAVQAIPGFSGFLTSVVGSTELQVWNETGHVVRRLTAAGPVEATSLAMDGTAVVVATADAPGDTSTLTEYSMDDGSQRWQIRLPAPVVSLLDLGVRQAGVLTRPRDRLRLQAFSTADGSLSAPLAFSRHSVVVADPIGPIALISRVLGSGQYSTQEFNLTSEKLTTLAGTGAIIAVSPDGTDVYERGHTADTGGIVTVSLRTGVASTLAAFP